ncbi:glycosyltransferase family 4 protein [Parabacteroides sp. FAFU027]|uniref:glycosyltransferase family 4 protein n=1 Tax=Parabacteroides sp. FAFU027 TaxID=2922715 RepID=UPI001FB00F25|nr:glycosyltransferase family 1 protein [Parabacteroides sp. FAFU027]
MKERITYIFRKKSPRCNSIEQVFYGVMECLDPELYPTASFHVKESGGGIKAIISNICAVRKTGRGIRHITGDIHYVALGTSSPSVLTIHDTGSALQGNFIKQFLIKLLWFWLPALCVDRITVISEFSRQEVLRLIPFAKRKIRVIPNAYRQQIDHDPKPFKSACPRILHLGTKSNKNLERTIEALKGIHCELMIIGKLTAAQHKQLDQSGILYQNEFFIPFERIIEHYRVCDLVCFASTYEGFGLPILEAQATGRPVITSRVASMPEVAGEGALLVDPLNIDDIRNAVNRIISDETLRAGLIAKGLENIKRFTPESVAMQYIDLYKEIGGIC